MKKNIIASIASMTLVVNTIGINSTVNAKVIEPEIVKTETWTTSYYIDDDMKTLYPYIDCQADIYNDGTVKVYFWNTHEWDGFATVKHNVTIINSAPYSNASIAYILKYKLTNIDDFTYYAIKSSSDKTVDYSMWDAIDLSYYPDTYNCSYYSDYSSIHEGFPSNFLSDMDFWYYGKSNTDNTSFTRPVSLQYYMYYGTLPTFSIDAKPCMTFTPQVDPTETYEFRILGHDFTITPELLSGNVVAEPQLSETEQKIKSLEEENAKLKEENNNLQRVLASYGNRAYGDMNNDNIVDGRDATILLTYYAKTSVGWVGSLDDFIKEQKGE